MQAKVLIYITLGFVISGCTVTRQGVAEQYSNLESRDVRSFPINEIVSNNITNRSFNIQRADIKIIQENITVRFTVSLKFCLPDSLLITVRSRAGLEAGRALITDDTVLINDRINKALLIGKPEILGKKYGIEPDLIYAIFGDMIIGEDDREQEIKCDRGVFTDVFRIYNRQVAYTIDCQRRKTIMSYFEGDITSGNITARFDEIKSISNVKYPRNIHINDDKQSMDIIIEIKKIELPWKGRINFVPGSNYKVLKIR